MESNKVIIPHLWFDTKADEAAEFYCSLFPKSKILSKSVIKDTASGDCEYLSFTVWGQKFEAISAGPYFSLNPSISMMVNFDPLFFQDQENPELAAKKELNRIWKKLIEDGEALMELGKYDFSPLYGWVKDRYGMTWQLILTDPGGDPRPAIMPSMLFVGNNYGKAEEAASFYKTLFPRSEKGLLLKYPAGMEPDIQGTVMFSDFKLGETWMTAADSAYDHKFQFNEALSFIIYCKDQNEIDYLWNKLSAVPKAEQCGWLKDKYGISWQIVPDCLKNMMEKGNDNQKQAVTKSFSKMKKIDLAGILKVFENHGVNDG